MPSIAETTVLAAAGTALILQSDGQGLPQVVHWGADPGPLGADLSRAIASGVGPTGEPRTVFRLVPSQSDGWQGRPGISGHREGSWPHLRLEVEQYAATTNSVLLTARDADASVTVTVDLVMEPTGVLRMRTSVRNDGSSILTVDAVSCQLPFSEQATEVLDFSGRWAAERSPQRRPLKEGTTLRESRRGKTGHDATGLLIAGSSGFGFRTGQVWAVHTGWSGEHVHWLENLPEAAPVLAGGELLYPGEMRLAAGESYETPWTYFVWSGDGLDGMSARLHEHLRARPTHPHSARKVICNTWEAVYFDLDLAKLIALAEQAATTGCELFVVDDGWFTGRRSDNAGLGDWEVDTGVWPQGLHPLVNKVRSLGMAMGLWFEPEMINPDSNLARAHPDWILAAPGRLPPLQRNQHVLNIAIPEAFAYLLDRLDRLVGEYQLDYIKWDHNRDLLVAIHEGHAGVHDQTEALYRLIDELHKRHPQLEIESCGGGGGRIDYGILARTDRVWASDTNDPLQRQAIQRWTGLLLPPELMGSHLGAARAHISGRKADLPFRLATSLFASAGIELNLTLCSPQELETVASWLRLYKRLRPLLHSGCRVNADRPGSTDILHGVVAQDGSSAVYSYVQMDIGIDPFPARLLLPGLNPTTLYTVTVCSELPPARPDLTARAPWLAGPGLLVPGMMLATVGLTAPLLDPAQAIIFEAVAQ